MYNQQKNIDNQANMLSENVTNNNIKLSHINVDLMYELMSIPTLSNHEYRMVEFVVLWARRNNIKYEFDDYGNVYLTKGSVKEGCYYPCLTAHLDSVQSNHRLYALAGQNLDVKTRIVDDKHEIYVDGMGIGGDDKAGVLIALTMFSFVDNLKACFFLEEETGCRGSSCLNESWFNDVGYVIGYDSPDLNRAAWCCSGEKLFDKDFFINNIKDICEEHGLTDFRSEPYTDVKMIRSKTNIICMNFGSGYYNAHSSIEYCVIEDMDSACKMGNAIINHLGEKRYELKSTNIYSIYSKDENGKYVKNVMDDDEKYFNSLKYKSYSSNNSFNSLFTIIQNIKSSIKSICENNNIDFKLFENTFSKEIRNWNNYDI
jgi:hypothetical protein